MADLRQGIIDTARAIGADPLDLATAISYETGGTFNPTMRGPTTQWGQHRGLIQFGEPQAQQYGVNWDDPVGSQLGSDGAIARYMVDRGYEPGMGLLDLYSTINAGAPGLYNRTDANNGGAPGTVREKVEGQMAGHRQRAIDLLGGAAPQGVPSMAMTPDPQPQGLMSRLFGGPADTPDTSPTDPYANLSRQQRMMLGFAALRDAGASFAGRDTDFFAQTLGGYEDARERERLRRQGELQNRATALQGLAQIQQQIAIARARGVQPSDAQLQLEQYFTDMLTSAGGGLGGAAPRPMPTPEAVTPAAAAVTPAPEAAAVTPAPEAAAVTPEAAAPEAPAPETVAAEPKASDALLAEITELQEMQSELMRLGDDTTDIQQRITLLDRRYRDQLKVEQEAAAAAQELLATPDQLDLATANLARMRNIENASDEDLNRILGPVVSAIDDESPTAFQIARNIRVGEEGGALLAEIDQIIAGEFLIAFDQLKGGGQITNIEGQRAVKARQQLTSRNVSPEAYRQAARELRMITENGLARAKGQEAPHSLEAISGGVTGEAAPDSQTLTDDAASFLGLAVQQ